MAIWILQRVISLNFINVSTSDSNCKCESHDDNANTCIAVTSTFAF